jgi:hypothetical protein
LEKRVTGESKRILIPTVLKIQCDRYQRAQLAFELTKDKKDIAG